MISPATGLALFGLLLVAVLIFWGALWIGGGD